MLDSEDATISGLVAFIFGFAVFIVGIAKYISL